MSNVDVQLGYCNKIRDLCKKHFTPPDLLPDGTKNPNAFPAMRAEAISATECLVSLARIFKGLQTLHPSFLVPTVVDLSFGLSENQFWKQHNAVLVPVFKSSLHAFLQSRVLEVDQHKTPEKEAIRERQSKQWYALFTMAYDCMYGTAKTYQVSTMLIQELEVIA